jgi:hypothetical protein
LSAELYEWACVELPQFTSVKVHGRDMWSNFLLYWMKECNCARKHNVLYWQIVQSVLKRDIWTFAQKVVIKVIMVQFCVNAWLYSVVCQKDLELYKDLNEYLKISTFLFCAPMCMKEKQSQKN